MFTLAITQEAHADILSAFLYYEAQLPNLGKRFLSAIEDRYKQLIENPFQFSYASFSGNKIWRDVIVRDFPYLIVFEITKSVVTIYAIHHTKKHPSKKFRT